MPTPFRSLAAQIIALVLGLLLTVQLVSYLVLRDGIDRNAEGTLITELRKGERVWRRLVEDLTRRSTEQAARLAGHEAVQALLAAPDPDAAAAALAALNAAPPAAAGLHFSVLDTGGQPRHAQGAQAEPLLRAWREQTGAATTQAALVWLDQQPFWVTPQAVAQGSRTVGWVLAAAGLPATLVRDAQDLTTLHFLVLNRSAGAGWHEAWAAPAPSRRTAAVLQALAADERVPAAGKEWSMQVGERWLARAVPLLDPAQGVAQPAAPGGATGAVVILRSVDEASAPFARLQLTLGALVALGVLVTVIGSILLARRLTRPLSVLAEAAHRLGRGDYERRIAVSATHEIGSLAAALEGMRVGIRERDQRITQLAYTDGLTQLPNRQQFLRLIGHRLKPTTQGQAGCAVLLLNVDRFRVVNQALGRAFGDRLLREVGKRLNEVRAHGQAEQDNDVVARLGEDTFGVLLARADLPSVHTARQKIQRTFEKPVRLDEHRIDLSAGIGAAIGPEHGNQADLLLGRAELAMQIAKRDHLGFQIFDPAMDTATPAALSLLGELRQALDRHQLRLVLQPRVDLRTEQVVGAEALLRWQHPQRGLLMPADFIAFAEQTGFIRQITAWVLEATVSAAADLQTTRLPLRLGLNLSTRDLSDDLPVRVQDCLRRHQVPPSALCLEITETAMMDDPQRALRTLKALADMGVHLSIDDFGTGYSSLSYLKRLPVHELKIDKSFVMRMERDLDDAKIVHSTIALAHNLGLSVVAEGVETAATWKLLAGLHCDQAQGYLIAKPMPVDDFAAWCRRWHAPATDDVELATAFREMI